MDNTPICPRPPTKIETGKFQSKKSESNLWILELTWFHCRIHNIENFSKKKKDLQNTKIDITNKNN